jgi:5-methyltetrahydrofolate--homocysteine methyltransferase
MNIRETLNAAAAERTLILDGAMGTMIQSYRKPDGQALGEEDFRGLGKGSPQDGRFAAHRKPLLGCNDLLCLTRPEVIAAIHEAYLKAGADIIETCSFNATSVSLEDFGLGDLAYEISAAAAGIARKAADAFSTPEKKRFVAGSMGPTAKSASLSPDINDPGKRGITFDELAAAYYDNARGLLDGGADILLIETVFDTLNAKAAIFAIKRLEEERHTDIPVMISATIAGPSGRLLSGQTLEAFCVSVLHADPWALGLNCSFGSGQLKAHAAELAALAPCLTSAHPNAGMPNQFGAYDETPESMAAQIEEYLGEGLVNIIGGCCGTTPAHIAAIAAKAAQYRPRPFPGPAKQGRRTCLAGLESLTVGGAGGRGAGGPPVYIGERTNVAGSRKFLRLIGSEKYAEALEVAQGMIGAGARIINICMDDAMLDAEQAMVKFLTLALSDPDIARVPFMIDSSRWTVIESALKYIQGKALANSISLKDGEGEFLRRARLIRGYGAAVVVMLFDEQGQAAEYERKIEIAGRSYRLLTENGFPPEDIVFDPNILSIATGISEHDRYGLNFIRACAWIREHCPGAQISGGLSNLSFSFRGNDTVREAMHAVFLKHAAEAGLTMAILNPAGLVSYDEVDRALLQAAEDVILCRDHPPEGGGTADTAAAPGAVERLLALAMERSAARQDAPADRPASAPDWRSLPVQERIIHAMLKGIDSHIAEDVLEIRPRFGKALEIVETLLMKGMQEVGDRFGQGKMFLPQVIRSARVMKKAVTALEPFIQAEKGPAGEESSRAAEGGIPGTADSSPSSGGAKILLATVKGDVHDIGKNIVGLVLSCNGYEIVDLGVMTPAERIIEAALCEKVDAIGLSGLISPSLDEMIHTARELEKNGIMVPLLIGGAAASLAHTGLRIAPEYSGPVAYVPDAGKSAETIRALLSETERSKFLDQLETSYREAEIRHEKISQFVELIPLEKARENNIPVVSYKPIEPKIKGIIELIDYPPERVIPHIDWKGFFQTWDLAEETYPSGYTARARREREDARNKLLEEAQVLLDHIVREKTLRLRGVVGFFPAGSSGDDVVIRLPGGQESARFCFPRNQEKKRGAVPNACLADFIMPETAGSGDWIGLFALSGGFGLAEAAAAYQEKNDDYGAILLASLANVLTEAFAEEAHLRARGEWWGYDSGEDPQSGETIRGKPQGIRPAFGYPTCPDHRDKELAFRLLEARERCGLELTDTGMIIPAASVCGMYIAHPSSYYFGVGRLGEDQIEDWARRKGISPLEAQRRLGRI